MVYHPGERRPPPHLGGMHPTVLGFVLMRRTLRALFAAFVCAAHGGAALAQTYDAETTNRMRQEARDMVREDWAKYNDLIRALHLGEHCGAVEAFQVELATRRLTNTMLDEWIRAGLVNDRLTDPQRLTRDWIGQAKDDAGKPGACNRLTPALRARLRKTADDLIALP